ncbi:murein L,D-transpeptidase [Myxococcota bacterium]|nr:murein L,D-transpeptidase [Myxococcota bacterium]
MVILNRLGALLIINLLFLGFSGMAMAQTVPSSSRSRQAIARVEAQLKKDLKKQGLSFGSAVYIRIFKEESQLEVWIQKEKSFELFRTYPVCTWGQGTLGPKQKQGDGQAPEGFYFVKPAKLNPVSSYHLAFNLGYPNAYDRAHKRTGDFLMVHGNCVSIGCYAMTNEKIEEIYAIIDAALRGGQSLFRTHIFPFRMTAKAMQKHKKSVWFDFWTNLKEGYDTFENNGNTPPNVEVKEGRYIFNIK